MLYAPITLFVYNRPDHTRKTVEALAANDLAIESDLFIYADGPKNLEFSGAVNEVRRYIRTISAFKSVTIIERDKNLGLSKSIITGVTEIVIRFGRIIVLEDDLVTSRYFLRYMNDALCCYENDEEVVAIHGYTFPLKISLPDTFFLRSTGCWGWGTWQRGWIDFEPDGRKLLEQLLNSQLTQRFDMNGSYPNTHMLEEQVNGNNDSWAVRWYAATFLKNKFTLYPGISLVKNIGHDCSGEHCAKSSYYSVDLSEKRVDVRHITAIENPLIAGSLEEYFRRGHAGIIRYWVWKLSRQVMGCLRGETLLRR